MAKYERWREKRIHKIGTARQLKAEAAVEKQLKTPFITVEDTATGEQRRMKKTVADILKAKKQVQAPKLVFSIPDLSHIDWSK